MPLLSAWLRLELRRRWRSLLVLALLVALSTGTVLTAVAGARRGDSALDRLLARTLPATAVVSPFQPGFDWAPVRALPEVAALTTAPGYTSFAIDEIPGYPQGPPYVPADGEMMRTIETPVVLAGRLADPTRADEAVVTPAFARTHGVGSTLTLRLDTPEALQAGLLTEVTGPPGGPVVAVHVVGVVRSPWWSDEPGGSGTIIPSAGLFAAFGPNLVGSAAGAPLNALVRLHGGEADLPAFRAGLARVSGRPDIDVLARADFVEHERSVLAFESTSLLAFGAAALLASLVLVGQAVARYAAASAADLLVLRALGMRRAGATAIGAAGPVLAAALGVLLGLGGALAASIGMPFGTAARFEPAPGLDLDPLVLCLGAAGALLATLGGTLAAAWWAQSARATTSGRRSAVATAATRAGLPVPVVTGIRFALEPGRGRSATPVRPALVAAVTGVLGIVAAFTFSAGVADAADHPERFGQTFSLVAVFGFGGQDIAPPAPVLAALAADPDVAGVNDMRLAAAQSGATSVPTFSYHPGAVSIVLTAGSAPAGVDDVVLAPRSAARLRADVGSLVPFTGETGTRTLRVSGIGFVPDSLYNDYDSGAWVTADGYDRLFTGFKQHGALLVLRPGTDPGAALPRLSAVASTAAGVPSLLIFPAAPPQQLAEIQNVRVLPVVLGGFLVLLAVGAVGHVLAASVRRRRGDLAVLRALGMTRGQVRGIFTTQALVLAGAGLLAGLPLGLALGRTLWRVVADLTPLQYLAPVSAVAVAVVPAALLVAVGSALWPGRQATRQQVGLLLRAER
jgi:hypothetical protein